MAGADLGYPHDPQAREQWILARRALHKRRAFDNPITEWRPYGSLLEKERAPTGELEQVTTIFLTNRECPWRCLMCDLWKNTLPHTVPLGAIPAQINYALAELEKNSTGGAASNA